MPGSFVCDRHRRHREPFCDGDFRVRGLKKVSRERGEDAALQLALALEAARHPLPLADSIIYAAAMRHEAKLWTQDEHFKDFPNVRYFPKPTAP